MVLPPWYGSESISELLQSCFLKMVDKVEMANLNALRNRFLYLTENLSLEYFGFEKHDHFGKESPLKNRQAKGKISL